jgi:hypothetical protein
VTLVYIHDQGCRYAQLGNGTHEDAAKRAADAYNLHRIAGGDDAVGKIIAVKLSDGTSDGVAYPSKYEAVRHQRHNERYCMFLRIRRASMTVCAAATLLRSARMLYDLGHAQADRDHSKGGLQVISRLTLEDAARQDVALARALARR